MSGLTTDSEILEKTRTAYRERETPVNYTLEQYGEEKKISLSLMENFLLNQLLKKQKKTWKQHFLVKQ